MAPLDMPPTWKRLQDTMEDVLHEEFDVVVEEEIAMPDDDPHVDMEVFSNFDEAETSSFASDIDEIIDLTVASHVTESEADSIEYFLPIEDGEGDTTPVLPDAPDARRRLFDGCSDEEDDDDGVAYLSDS